MKEKLVVAAIALVLVASGALFFGGQDGKDGRDGRDAVGAISGTDVYNDMTFFNTVDFRNGVTVTAVTSSATSSLLGRILYQEAIDATSTPDFTLLLSDSGTTFYIGTAGLDIALPAVPGPTTVGVWYRFVVDSNFASTNMTVHGGQADASDDKIQGAIVVDGADVSCINMDTISFVNSAELPGDYVELRSDGVNWYVSGQGSTAGSITCTDAD